jgi:hypothetical protein
LTNECDVLIAKLGNAFDDRVVAERYQLSKQKVIHFGSWWKIDDVKTDVAKLETCEAF